MSNRRKSGNFVQGLSITRAALPLAALATFAASLLALPHDSAEELFAPWLTHDGAKVFPVVGVWPLLVGFKTLIQAITPGPWFAPPAAGWMAACAGLLIASNVVAYRFENRVASFARAAMAVWIVSVILSLADLLSLWWLPIIWRATPHGPPCLGFDLRAAEFAAWIVHAGLMIPVAIPRPEHDNQHIYLNFSRLMWPLRRLLVTRFAVLMLVGPWCVAGIISNYVGMWTAKGDVPTLITHWLAIFFYLGLALLLLFFRTGKTLGPTLSYVAQLLALQPVRESSDPAPPRGAGR